MVACRVNRYQVGSSVFLLVSAASFCWQSVASHSTADFPAVIATYSTAICLFAFCALRSACIDPSDPAVKLRKNNPKATADRQKCTKYCPLCRIYVEAASKHCRVCRTCTADFDHHCKWLNNCIGRGNYCWFLAAAVSLEGVGFVQVSVGGRELIELFSDMTDSHTLDVIPTQFSNSKEANYALFALFSFLTVLWLCILVLGAYLLAFHAFLRIRRKSTYAYLLSRRKGNKVAPIPRTTQVLTVHPGTPDPSEKDSKTTTKPHSANTSVAENDNAKGTAIEQSSVE